MFYQKSKAKDIIADQETLTTIVHETLDKMASIVGRTLGPGGRPVIIEREGLAPLATKDGVTVAKALGLAEAGPNLIVDAAKEICINTAREAGDGTTTAIVLANDLVKRGHIFLRNNPKYNPQRMISELQQAYKKVVVPYLSEVAQKVTSDKQLLQVAKISANGDDEVAEAVVEAVNAAGDDGKVLITEGQSGKIEVQTIEGYIVTTGLKDLGQIGPAFINDKANQQVKMDNGYVVLFDGSLNDLKIPGKIQEAVADNQGFSDATPIIVFAHSFADTVLDRFAKTTKGGLTIVPVKTPRTGLANSASMFLQDMAVYTGGRVYDPGTAEDIELVGFGNFETAKVNLYETFIIGEPDDEALNGRISELKAVMEQAFSPMDKGHVQAAIAKLTGGVSTISVGGSSDLEIRERMARVEDAEEAVRSAIAEGIVTGGGSIHLRLSHQLQNHPDKKPAWDILIEALQAPFNLLLTNCGESPEEVLKILGGHVSNLEKKLPLRVFDAEQHAVVDPIFFGIIEPAKVVRVSIANALSVASLLTTLGGIVVVPRDSQIEMQMELANQAFSNMMNAGE